MFSAFRHRGQGRGVRIIIFINFVIMFLGQAHHHNLNDARMSFMGSSVSTSCPSSGSSSKRLKECSSPAAAALKRRRMSWKGHQEEEDDDEDDFLGSSQVSAGLEALTNKVPLMLKLLFSDFVLAQHFLTSLALQLTTF